MIFETTFDECFRDGACRYGYRRAARAFGGIKTHGRETKTDLRDIIRKLHQNDAMWVLESTGVFHGLGRSTVWEVWDRILPVIVRAAVVVPCEDEIRQQILDKDLKNGGQIRLMGVHGWTSILYHTNWEATQKLLIHALDKEARA